MAGDAERSRAEDREAAADLWRRARAGFRTHRPTLSSFSARAVLFDWDGTLIDSAAATLRCYRRLFSPYGIDFTEEVFARTYAPDWYRTYEGVGLPRGRWKEADAAWLKIYADEACDLRPGAARALARLSAARIPAGLVTSGSRVRVEEELERHGLTGAFSAVVCSEDAVRRKPDPEALFVALDRLSARAEEAAYVGDSPEDVRMARAANVFAVGVEGGFPNSAALRESAPDVFAGDLAGAMDALGVPAAGVPYNSPSP